MASVAALLAACDPSPRMHVRVTVPPGEALPPASTLRVEVSIERSPAFGDPRAEPRFEPRQPGAVHATPDGRGYEFTVATRIGQCMTVRLRAWADANANGQVDLRELVGETAQPYIACQRSLFRADRNDVPPIELRPFWPPP